MAGESAHSSHVDCPQDIKPANGKVGQRVTYMGILPVDNASKAAFVPEYVARPVVAVE